MQLTTIERWTIYRLKNLVRWRLYWFLNSLCRRFGAMAGSVQEWRTANDREIETILWHLFY